MSTIWDGQRVKVAGLEFKRMKEMGRGRGRDKPIDLSSSLRNPITTISPHSVNRANQLVVHSANQMKHVPFAPHYQLPLFHPTNANNRCGKRVNLDRVYRRLRFNLLPYISYILGVVGANLRCHYPKTNSKSIQWVSRFSPIYHDFGHSERSLDQKGWHHLSHASQTFSFKLIDIQTRGYTFITSQIMHIS